MGQKQRIIIARVLYSIEDVDVFVFDEYLSGVNQDWAQLIHKTVIEFLKRKNKIGIFITHNIKEAKLCDRMLFIENKTFRSA